MGVIDAMTDAIAKANVNYPRDIHGRLAGTIGSHSELKCVSAELLKALFPMEKAVRLLGVSISGFSVGEIDRPEQMPLAF
jgi:hypothetical protein